MKIHIDTKTTAGYRKFLAVKKLPSYRFVGHMAEFPDEYAGLVVPEAKELYHAPNGYEPPAWMFDYQRDITRIAIRKRKYCVFADCGLGKTAIFLEFAKHAKLSSKGRVLIVSPLMVIPQTIAEANLFYGEYDYPIEQVHAADLEQWLNGTRPEIGITNYEAIRPELTRGNLSGLILDESSMLKSHYGKWGTKLISMGRGLAWKLCCTGTPAPNDRIEYANHAVFMDAFPNVNSFLARYFVNRGQTQERWVLKPHALRPFYRSLSHWCIFLSNPATYGWEDNTATIPPIKIHTHEVPLTEEQQRLAFGGTGRLFADRIGGITSRSVLSQIAKGSYKGKPIETHKPRFIRELIESWPSESTLVWCRFNAEQERLAKEMPDAGNISGSTPHDKRKEIVDAFKRGELKTLISKPKILGFGLNLQVATRQVFSALDDSYEEFYQAVKRSNRIGSTRPLNVHLPLTDIERIQAENVLRKMQMVQADTEAQEEIFRESRMDIA
jgi:hypothetical protein